MNLVVTCSRHLEEESTDEIAQILLNLGDKTPKIEISSFSGIILIDTHINPLTVVMEIKKIILEEPWKIRYCHRFIPIVESTIATVENIVYSVKNQIKTIKDTDTYRITIEKRGSELSSKELIDSVARNIPNKVSLENFDWNIVIQIIGKIAGVSLLKEKDIVSTLKVKRDSIE